MGGGSADGAATTRDLIGHRRTPVGQRIASKRRSAAADFISNNVIRRRARHSRNSIHGELAR